MALVEDAIGGGGREERRPKQEPRLRPLSAATLTSLDWPLSAATRASGGAALRGRGCLQRTTLVIFFAKEEEEEEKVAQAVNDIVSSDQVIRENPASRGTETSAEVLVGPPWGGWSETPVNSSGTRLTLTLGGGLEGPLRPVMTPYPFPSASSVGVGRRRGSAWVRQFSPP